MWDSPSRASFGKVGSIMKRFRVPIDRHPDGHVHCGNSFDAGFSPYQSTRLSRYNAVS
jgi:hypothetical protein